MDAGSPREARAAAARGHSDHASSRVNTTSRARHETTPVSRQADHVEVLGVALRPLRRALAAPPDELALGEQKFLRAGIAHGTDLVGFAAANPREEIRDRSFLAVVGKGVVRIRVLDDHPAVGADERNRVGERSSRKPERVQDSKPKAV
jgi:hypothetical protein